MNIVSPWFQLDRGHGLVREKWAGHTGTAHFRGETVGLDLAREGVDAVKKSAGVYS